MRRAILTIILYLMLGFVTSIAVAWMAAVVLQATDMYTRQYLLFGLTDLAAVRIYGRPDSDGTSWDVYSRSTPFSFHSVPVWSVFSDPPGQDDWVVMETAAGFPAFCFRAERHQPTHDEHPFSAHSEGWLVGSIRLPWPRWDWDGVNHVPTTPLRRGLLINTIFWAICWAVLAIIPVIWRYNRSLRWLPKGKCGWCGYNAKATRDKCTECGHDRRKPPKLVGAPSLLIGSIALVFMTLTLMSFAFVFREKSPIQPIHSAAYQGDVKTVREELDRGVDPDLMARSHGSITVPLVLAIEGGHDDIAHVLLDAGADPNIAGHRGQLPLTLAAEQNEVDLVERLLKAGADPDLVGHLNRNALMWAAAKDSIELARILIDAGADPSFQGYLTPLNDAASAEMIEFLLDAGADPTMANTTFASPLTQALLDGRRDVAERLVNRGLKPGYSTLAMAITRTDLATVKWLVEIGVDQRDPKGIGRPLFGSVHHASTDEALWVYLLELGAPVDDPIHYGPREVTPLWNTVVQPDASATFVKFLLDHGADPNFVGFGGKTCIEVARRDDIRQLLIDAAERRSSD